MSSEYEKLRDEIVTWQERRFTVFTGTMTLLFVFASYILAAAKEWSWATAMSIEFLIVACAALISWFGGWANSIAGAYISVVHEKDPNARWETVTEQLREQMPITSFVNMNCVFATIYTLFLSASMLLFIARCPRPPSRLDIVGMVVLMFVCLVGLLANFAPQLSYPRAAFKRRIRDIIEKQQSAPPSSP